MSIKNDNIRNKAEQLLAERDDGLRPIWVRAPKAGQCEYHSGLGRGKLYQLEAAGVIKSASLKPVGAVRGVRLFNLKSLLAYVESCAKGPDNEKALSPNPQSPQKQQ